MYKKQKTQLCRWLFALSALLCISWKSESGHCSDTGQKTVHAPKGESIADETPNFDVVIQSQKKGIAGGSALSKDGRYILSRGLRLWDRNRGIFLKRLSDIKGIPYFDFMHDSRRIVTSSDRGEIKIWDVATSAQIGYIGRTQGRDVSWDNRADLDLLADGVHALRAYPGRFSNGDRVIVELVNLDEQTVVKTYDARCSAPDGEDKMVQFTVLENHILPDDKNVATICDNGQISVWNMKTGAVRWNARLKHDWPSRHVVAAAISQDGKQMVTDGVQKKPGRTLLLWNLETGKIINKTKRPDGFIENIITIPGSPEVLVQLNDLRTVNIKTGKTGKIFSGGLCSPYLSEDQSSFISCTGNGRFELTSLASGNTLRAFNHNSINRFTEITVAPYSAVAELITDDGGRYRWNADTLGFPQGVCPKCHIDDTAYSSDGRWRAELNRNNEISLYRIATGKRWSVVHAPGCYALGFSADSKKLVGRISSTVASSAPTKAWQVPNLKPIIPAVSTKPGINMGPQFSLKDGTHALLSHPTLALWNTQTGTHVFTYTDEGKDISSSTWTVSSDQKRLISIGVESFIDPTVYLRVFDLWTGKLLKRHLCPFDSRQAAFVQDNDHALVLDANGIISIWNLKTGVYASVLVSGSEWLIYTEDGYFASSRKGGNMLALVKGMNGFRIDQLATHYNRPDIILDRLELGSRSMKAHFRRLYQRRLGKLGLKSKSPTAVEQQGPVVQIQSFTQAENKLHLKFSCTDNRSALAWYIVYLNEVPIFGAEGVAIQGNQTLIALDVTLTGGKNKIEVSAMNTDGIISMRDSLTINNARKKKGDLYYLGFGVSNYDDNAMRLKYAAKDARDLQALFKRPQTAFNNVYTRLYQDQQVTRETVSNAGNFFKTAGVNDTVVLFIAGHGLYQNGSSSDYYYLISNSSLDNLADTAIPFEMVENLLQGIKPVRKLFLMDTCQSGVLEADEEMSLLQDASVNDLVSRGIRRTENHKQQKSQLGFISDRRRYIYNDIFRRSGTIVLSSSRGTEMSYEREDIENGVFTEEIIKAFSTEKADIDKDNRVTTDELRNYVINAVAEMTHGLQNPSVDRDNLEIQFDFPVFRN